MRTFLFALAVYFVSTQAAYAQTGSIQKAGVDLEFSCSSPSGDMVICKPERGHYGRYPALANWRFVGGATHAGLVKPMDTTRRTKTLGSAASAGLFSGHLIYGLATVIMQSAFKNLYQLV